MENFICVPCGAQFSQTAEPRHNVRFAKMNGNSFVMAGNSGRRCRSWRWIITTVSKKRRRNFSASERNRNSALPSALCLCSRPREICCGIAFHCSKTDDRRSQGARRRSGDRDLASHFYSSMVAWAEHFDAEIYLHARDRQWVMRESPRIHFWEGTTFRFGII